MCPSRDAAHSIESYRVPGAQSHTNSFFLLAPQSPITLLELGLFAQTKKLIVCCPDGFWRRGNVQVVCARYNVPLVDSLEALIALAQQRVQQIVANA